MEHIYQSFLVWPDGSIWGNLVAQVIISGFLGIVAFWRFEKQHKEHLKQIHNQITQSLKETNK